MSDVPDLSNVFIDGNPDGLPDATGYSIAPASGVIITEVEGGLPKRRAGILGGSNMINMQWSLNADEYKAFMLFYRNDISEGVKAFNFKGCLDSAEVETLTGVIAKGTLGVTNFKSLIDIKVSCTMYVESESTATTTTS